MINKYSNLKKFAAILPLIIFVSACGNEVDQNEVELLPTQSAFTQDILLTTEVGKLQRIPLYQTHRASTGDEVVLESISLNQRFGAENCQVPQQNGLELIYHPQNTGICEYQYTVRNGNSLTRSKLIAMATTTEAVRLPDLAHSAVFGREAAIEILLNADETLSVITVLGGGLAKIENNIIYYDATNTGLNRIVYSVLDIKSGIEKIGVINVTVTEASDGNQLPLTPSLSVNALPGETLLIIPNISDPDLGDEPQLIGVVSLEGAAVEPAVNESLIDSDYFNNKAFTFMASKPGIYSAYYTAHDHSGGYNTGLVTVIVEGEVGLAARDATFFRQPTEHAYDFKIDLRSFVTSSDISQVEFLGANFADISDDKNQDHLGMPTTETPVLSYQYPGGMMTGTVVIEYQVADPSGYKNAKIFISIGQALPEITELNTSSEIIPGTVIDAVSSCLQCEPSETRYDWFYGSSLYSQNTSIVVPNGVRGESLILVATPYNVIGMAGKQKSKVYSFE